MKAWRTNLTGITLALGAVLIAGCSYLGIPRGQDKVEANSLESEIANYQSWETPDWVAGFTESAHPLPAYVKYYVNPAGMSDIDNPPNGSIFVKEQFNKNKELIGMTVMKKIDGYDPANKDWYWAIADKNAKITNAGKLNSSWTSACISCHKKGDGGDDLLFVND